MFQERDVSFSWRTQLSSPITSRLGSYFFSSMPYFSLSAASWLHRRFAVHAQHRRQAPGFLYLAGTYHVAGKGRDCRLWTLHPHRTLFCAVKWRRPCYCSSSHRLPLIDRRALIDENCNPSKHGFEWDLCLCNKMLHEDHNIICFCSFYY